MFTTDNVAISSYEIVDTLTITGSLTATRDGSALNLDGDIFVLQAANPYVGSFSLEDGSNAQLYLNIQSPTFITGHLTVNLMIDNVPCSATVGVSMSRN